MNFRVEEVNERPVAVFDNEESPRSWLLAFFLEEARVDTSLFLKEIEIAERSEKTPTGYTCNSIDVSFYNDRAVLEELYPASGDEDDAVSTEIPLAEAKQLLLNWQKALNEWEAKRDQSLQAA